MNADQSENVPAIEKFLWEIALRIEDGRLSLSEIAMRQAQDNLMHALNKNASDAEISSLLDKYRQTLSDYFDRLVDSLKELDKETSESLGLGRKSQILRRQDLMRMLKDVSKFIRDLIKFFFLLFFWASGVVANDRGVLGGTGQGRVRGGLETGTSTVFERASAIYEHPTGKHRYPTPRGDSRPCPPSCASRAVARDAATITGVVAGHPMRPAANPD